MRRTFFAVLVLFLVYTFSSVAQIGIGFQFGLSTPNDKINDVYNSSTLQLGSILDGTLLRSGTKSGFHIGAKLRLPMSDNALFTGGVMWNRFPETELRLEVPGQDTIVLGTVQNIIPITVGLNFYLLRSFLGIYGTGELSYNFISSTVDIQKKGVNIPLNLDTAPTQNRVGFGLGAGLDIDIKLLLANLEFKYNIANLIGQTGDEKTKAYYTLSLGVFFGNPSPK